MQTILSLFNNRSISTKVMTILFGSLAVVAFSVSVLLWMGQQQAVKRITPLTSQVAAEQATQTTLITKNFLELQHQLLLSRLGTYLATAEHLVEEAGGLRVDEEKVSWEAINQITKQKTTLDLPKVMLGDQWLQQIKGKESVALVDDVIAMTGATCTVFQRMNDNGDMLRVATNIRLNNGNRAIGTYIPSTSPVVQTVLSGETFRGRAYVVDNWYVTVYKPLFDDNREVIGLLYVGVPMKNLGATREVIRSARVGQSGRTVAISASGKSQYQYQVAKSKAEDGQDASVLLDAEGQSIYNIVVDSAKAAEGDVFEQTFTLEQADGSFAQRTVAASYFPQWDWVLISEAELSEFQHTSNVVEGVFTETLWKTAGVTVLAILASLTLGYFILRWVTLPIRETVAVLRDISEGEGDLTKHIKVNAKDELGELAECFNTFVDKLRDLIYEVSGVTNEVAAGSTQISASSEELSSGMADAAQQTSLLGDTVTEVNLAVSQVVEESNRARETSTVAGEKAQEGGDIMHQTVEEINAISEMVNNSASAVKSLGEQSESIGEVISVINDIADQTNLLALNAAIEAARAGEQGRGFAVVADEVRKLADRTTQATTEIAQSIKDIQTQTTSVVDQIENGVTQANTGVELAKNASQFLEAIVAGSGEVAQQIDSINGAADRQAQSTDQMTNAIQTMNALIQESANSVSQTAEATNQLSSRSESLQVLVSRFKV